MPVRGYRGVTSGLTSEAHEVSRYFQTFAIRAATFLFSQTMPNLSLAFPGCSQESFLCVLCALCANPVFQDLYKNVSRRRKKKKRLRRDDLVGYRGVTNRTPRYFHTFAIRAATILFSQTLPN